MNVFDPKTSISPPSIPSDGKGQWSMSRSILFGGVLVSGALIAGAAIALEARDMRYLQGTGQCPGCNLSEAVLVRAQLMGAQLMDIDLSRSNLAHASLMGANLWGADLTGGNLINANLTGADLSYANLSDAHLGGAILYDVSFNGATTQGAFYTEDTIFDPEVNPASLGMIFLENNQDPEEARAALEGVVEPASSDRCLPHEWNCD